MSRFFRHYFTTPVSSDSDPYALIAKDATQQMLDLILDDLEGLGEGKSLRDNMALAARIVAAGVIKLGGDWSQLHPDLDPSPTWPSLTSEEALTTRGKVIAHLTAKDLQALFDAIVPTLGLTPEEEGN